MISVISTLVLGIKTSKDRNTGKRSIFSQKSSYVKVRSYHIHTVRFVNNRFLLFE